MHPCETCALRRAPLFSAFTAEELAFMMEFREGEVTLSPGETLFDEGESISHFYTVLEGQGGRYKMLESGERQMVNFAFPGDLTGLSGTLTGEAGSPLQAASAMRLCRFRRARLEELFRNSPARAYDLTWIAATEEHFLADIIATLGRRTALQRTAWALLRIHQRLAEAGLKTDNQAVPFPFRQADLADALGLSLVHTNKTLARLRDWALLSGGMLRVSDPQALARLGLTDPDKPLCRPLL